MHGGGRVLSDSVVRHRRQHLITNGLCLSVCLSDNALATRTPQPSPLQAPRHSCSMLLALLTLPVTPQTAHHTHVPDLKFPFGDESPPQSLLKGSVTTHTRIPTLHSTLQPGTRHPLPPHAQPPPYGPPPLTRRTDQSALRGSHSHSGTYPPRFLAYSQRSPRILWSYSPCWKGGVGATLSQAYPHTDHLVHS